MLRDLLFLLNSVCLAASLSAQNREDSSITLLSQKKIPPPTPSDSAPLPSRYFDLKGEFIYWYSNQEGLGYTTKPEPTFTTSNFSNGSLVKPSFDWDPGFRIDTLYRIDQSYWTVGADVIWYQGHGSGHKRTSVTNGLFPAFSFADSTLPSDYVNQASIHWTLHSTIFDTLCAYNWVCNSFLTLIPSVGLRNVWLTEKANIHYNGGTFAAGPDIVHLKSRFYGIGPRIALKPQFLLGKGFSFYAEGAIALFGGWFNVHQSESFLGMKRATLTRHVSKIRWGVDTTAGFVYTYELAHKKNVCFDFGFDYLIFFRQNAFVHGSQYSLHSQGKALTLYGAHAGVGVRF